MNAGEKTNNDPDRLLDVNEAAELLQVKPGTLYSWASRGKVPYRKVGALVRFHRGELWAGRSSRRAAWGRRKSRGGGWSCA
jgi:excisionase family DNA binding protein